MIQDVYTVLWKELRELLRLGGGKRGAVFRILLSVGLLGVIWPWLLGAQFVSSTLPIVFSAMTAAMYVSAIVPDTFPGERERHTLETLLASRLPDGAILAGKILSVMFYGLGASLMLLLAGWVTVNLKESGPLLLYNVRVIVAALLFTLLAAGFMAGLGTVIALRAATVKQAQQILTTGVMLIFILPALLAEAWPVGWQWLIDQLSGRAQTETPFWIAAFLLLAQLIFFALARRMFQRSRLLVERAV